MSKSLKLATICLALSVGLAAAYWTGYQTGKSANPSTDTEQATLVTPDAPVLAQTTEPQSSGEEPSPQLAAIDPEDVDPADIDWASIANRVMPGIDQMLLRLNVAVDYSDAEIAAFNKLHVVAFNPTIQEVCNEEIAEHTTTGFITICRGVKEYPDHPYEDLDVETLLDLAEADAAAAVFVSRKAEDVNDRVGFALRAAALSGKPGPLLATAVKEFISNGITHTEDHKIMSVGGTVPNTGITRLILETVAQKMGDPRANPDVWQSYIDDFAKTEEERREALQLIKNATRSAMEGMAEIQQKITGSNQMQELLDA